MTNAAKDRRLNGVTQQSKNTNTPTWDTSSAATVEAKTDFLKKKKAETLSRTKRSD